MIGLKCGEAMHCLHSMDVTDGCGHGPHCTTCTVRRTVMDTMETGSSRFHVEAKLSLMFEGREEDLFFLLFTTKLRGRREPMVMLSMQDITQRKRAEYALQSTLNDLERRVRERTADLVSTNKSLSREIEERQRREEILRVSLMVSEFATARSLDELVRKALDEIERLTGSRIGFFHFMDEDEKTLSLHTWSSSTLGSFCTAEGKGRHYSVDEAGVWVDCIRERRPVIHNNYRELGHRKGLPPGHAEVIRELVVPVMRGERIVAVLGVGNKEHDYDARDVEVVLNLANLTWDVVVQKQTEERLLNSKATLRMVLDGISDPLILLDAEYRVKRINRAAKEYYGLNSYMDAAGKLCFEAFRGGSSPCEGCERPFSELKGYCGSYERRVLKDPDRIEQVVVDVVKEESGSPKATIVRISDITLAKMMEQQLIQSEKLASLGLLIAGIAHEINNPNTFILFNIPILRDYLREMMSIVDMHAEDHPGIELCGMPYGEFRKDVLKLVDNVEHGSSRINSTVKGLKEFSKTRGSAEKRLVALKPIIENALAICGAELRKRVKSLTVEVPEDLPPIYLDPEAVEQVLINLLINAAHSLDKQESRVRVSVLPDYRKGRIERCTIEVVDNGCGMDEKTMNKIFDPFFTTKASMMGTGLGLYVCQNLIQRQGGAIEVSSKPSVGTTFRIVLPNVPEVSSGGTGG
jgi:signal transduction histidine kinase